MPHNINPSHSDQYSPLKNYLNSLTEALQIDSQETLAFREHIQSLAEIAEENNWEFTSYFLGKAAESITDIDNS